MLRSQEATQETARKSAQEKQEEGEEIRRRLLDEVSYSTYVFCYHTAPYPSVEMTREVAVVTFAHGFCVPQVVEAEVCITGVMGDLRVCGRQLRMEAEINGLIAAEGVKAAVMGQLRRDRECAETRVGGGERWIVKRLQGLCGESCV